MTSDARHRDSAKPAKWRGDQGEVRKHAPAPIGTRQMFGLGQLLPGCADFPLPVLHGRASLTEVQMTPSVTCRQRKTRGRTSALVSILANAQDHETPFPWDRRALAHWREGRIRPIHGSLSAFFVVAILEPQLDDGHSVLGQSAGFVCTQHRCGAEGFDGGSTPGQDTRPLPKWGHPTKLRLQAKGLMQINAPQSAINCWPPLSISPTHHHKFFHAGI
jgi:hypothetical protein